MITPAMPGSYPAFWQPVSSFGLTVAGNAELIRVGSSKLRSIPKVHSWVPGRTDALGLERLWHGERLVAPDHGLKLADALLVTLVV